MKRNDTQQQLPLDGIETADQAQAPEHELREPIADSSDDIPSAGDTTAETIHLSSVMSSSLEPAIATEEAQPEPESQDQDQDQDPESENELEDEPRDDCSPNQVDEPEGDHPGRVERAQSISDLLAKDSGLSIEEVDQAPDHEEKARIADDDTVPAHDLNPVNSTDGDGEARARAAAVHDYAPLQALVDNPTAAAREITGGEFVASGSGIAGAAYRCMASLDASTDVEGWSIFISAASHIWDAGDYEASCQMMETARAVFNVPDVFRKRISDSISEAKELAVMHRAEKKFSGGDAEGAINMTRALRSAIASEYAAELKMRAVWRRNWRGAAFILSGALVAAMLVMSVIGLRHMITIVREPVDLALPSFPGAEPISRIGETFSREISGGSQDLEQALSETPDAPPAPPAQDVVSPEPIPTSPPIQASVFPEGVNDDMIQGCGVGYEVIARGTKLAIDRNDQVSAENLLAFSRQIRTACNNLGLSPDMFATYDLKMSDTDLDRIVQNTLSGR